MSQTTEELTIQGVEPEASCQHTLVQWHPCPPQWWRRSRIVDSFPCGYSPALQYVHCRCAHCGHSESGQWCASCLQAEVAEYEHGPLWCSSCDQFTMTVQVV